MDEIEFSQDGIAEKNSAKGISLEEANNYMNTVQKVSWRFVIAIAMLIVPPICLIQLSVMSECTNLISATAACGIGMGVLLGIAAIAVPILIKYGLKLSKYEYLEKDKIVLQYGVQGVVEKKMKEYDGKYRFLIALGVAICILGVCPLLIMPAFTDEAMFYVTGTNIILAASAIGVSLFVRSCMVYGSYQRLLQKGDYAVEEKQKRKALSSFPGAYWCVIVAVYLAISFSQNNWKDSWIVFAVAGVLYGAILCIQNAVFNSKRTQD